MLLELASHLRGGSKSEQMHQFNVFQLIVARVFAERVEQWFRRGQHPVDEHAGTAVDSGHCFTGSGTFDRNAAWLRVEWLAAHRETALLMDGKGGTRTNADAAAAAGHHTSGEP